jgi:ferrous iron transport protein B
VNKQKIQIALVGNPNVGKSVVFQYLTGIYADVSNYPGTTVEIAKAPIFLSSEEKKTPELLQNFDFEVIDTPGVYGISGFNNEEKATRDYVLTANIIVNVVSGISLERDLFLTKQLADMGKPMIVLLNQIDEAKLRKLEINTDMLAKELGVEIIEAVAISGLGLRTLKNSIIFQDFQTIKTGKISPLIEALILPYLDKVLTRSEALLVAEGDEMTAERHQIHLPVDIAQQREKIYQIRRDEVDILITKTVKRKAFSKRDFLGHLLLNPFIGSLAAALVLYVFLYQFLGIFVAGSVVDFLEKQIFNQYYEPAVQWLVTKFFPINFASMDNLLITNPLSALGTFLAGDYGVLTLTITYLYGLLLPLVCGFYFGLAILEDSGYLPRLAVLVDGVLSKLGMNGRAIVPLILGGGCVTMATVTTRLLNTDKEKIITMALLGLTIPCSAQLGVIQGLLSNAGGFEPWLIWSGTLLLVFVFTGTILNKLIPGECGTFISDIPPLRMPLLKNILQKTYTRSKVFMDEATPAFFSAAALVAGLQVSGLLTVIIHAVEPLMTSVLLLPKEVALSFILGMVRRDFGAFGLLDIPMTAGQLVTSCVVLTLFVPCIATVAVMIKERNLKTALAIWISSWVLAFGVGSLLARFLQFL